ncbi:bacterial Ig-like domain-containing protein [Proteiniclasticum sp. C24MP]|uniref:bacterial Ig-like domain-containing protein n=1 Tax=Proteiniclasticum sp. C24MP TaxID=3374101 RepID=UPI0037540FB8
MKDSILTIRNENHAAIHQKKGHFENYGILDFYISNYAIVSDFYSKVLDTQEQLFLINPNSNGEKYHVLRKNYVDVTPPHLVLLGDEKMNIILGEEYVEQGIYAIDEFDGIITEYHIEGAVDTSQIGDYVLAYVVYDATGNSSRIERIVSVLPKDVNNIDIDISKSDYIYTGAEIMPIYSIKDGDKVLNLNQDYTYFLSDNIEIGLATLTLKGINNYTNEVSIPFNIVPKELDFIEITKQPAKLSYFVGEELDLTGLEVIGTYNNGEKKIETITMENVNGFDSSIEETGQIVTVTVDGKTAAFTVDIISIVLESIEITKQPAKLSYFVGEELDLTGLEVTGTYNNGDKKIEAITMDNITGFSSSQAETGQIVTVTVNGKTATFAVDIIAIVLDSIEIMKQPAKLSYFVGEELNLTGLEVTGTYNNGEKRMETITMESVTGFDSSKAETGQIVTVTVEDKTATFTVDIIGIMLEYIEITKMPEKLSYFVGEQLDLTGLEVTGTYNNGEQRMETITMENITGFDSSNAETGQVVTVTVERKTTTLTVDIIAILLDSIEITKQPTKLNYFVGEELDLTGLEVIGTYNNGEQRMETITMENITGFDSSNAETGQVVTVTVDGKTTTFEVDIIAILLDSIEITKQPDKLNYFVGEELDLTGLEVIGTYNNGEKKIETITMENVAGFNSGNAEAGQVVTVSVDRKTATFTVEIIAILLESIEITKYPANLSYFVGEELDLTGLEVIGTYNNGKKKVETITIDNIAGFNSSQAEAGQVVTVTVNGKTATFTVDIIAILLDSIEITKQPAKLNYFVGEELDLTGLEVTGVYNNGEKKVEAITMDNITGFNSSQAEAGQVVTVTVDGKTATFTVDIQAILLDSIEITKKPSKLSYLVGEELDLTGLEVTGTYNNGEKMIENITIGNLTGFNSSQAEAGQVVTVTVDGKTASFAVDIAEKLSVLYRTHVQSYGWQDFVSDGMLSGTTGKAKRLEAIEIRTEGNENLGIKYSTHVEKIGWQNYVENGALSGTEGRALRLEAIKIELTGTDADRYDIYYRVHAEKFGWMGWAKNGQAAGTAGYAYRLEAIEISIVEKGENPYPVNVSAYRDKNTVENISYRTHVQSVGWQDFVSDGEMSGTEGQKLRLEGIEISLGDHLPSGSVEYSTHVQSIGWTDPVRDGAMSGTEGRALRLEAIRINLTGEISRQYDIYYRVHSEKIGWMGWARNGEDAGTSGYAYRLEGIEIMLVEKGANAPGPTLDHYRTR